MKYDDLTPLQILKLKGPIGNKGQKGEIGNIGLKGNKGDVGPKGNRALFPKEPCEDYLPDDTNINLTCANDIWKKAGCRGEYPSLSYSEKKTLNMLKTRAEAYFKYDINGQPGYKHLKKCNNQGFYSEQDIKSINTSPYQGKR